MTLTQSSVMIDPGEVKVFEGEMPQPLQCCARGQAPGRDVGEQALELAGCHAT
jgi:hypothetical protein